jgi:hypothetical protein
MNAKIAACATVGILLLAGSLTTAYAKDQGKQKSDLGTYVKGKVYIIEASTQDMLSFYCDNGDEAIGNGYFHDNPNQNYVEVFGSKPIFQGNGPVTGWEILAWNKSGSDVITVHNYVVCLDRK